MTNPQTITVVRGAVDRYGDAATGSEYEVPGCIVAPAATSTGTGPVAWSTTDFTLYPPAGADIQKGDQVRLDDGTLWKVDGMPFQWANPFTGATPGGEVRIVRVR